MPSGISTFTAHTLVPDQPEKTAPGRKKKPVMPTLPTFKMSEFEREWFAYFRDVYQAEYPDLTDADRLLLFLAAIEFIKYLRVAGAELATGEVISQARQHPGTQMRALLDQLSVTRRARQKQGPREEDDPNADLLLKLAQ